MGYTYAAGLADAVTDGYASLNQALSIHLSGNFYPPLPTDYVEPIIEALTAVAGGDPENGIALPEGIQPVPRLAWEDNGTIYVSAIDLVEITRAEPYLALV